MVSDHGFKCKPTDRDFKDLVFRVESLTVDELAQKFREGYGVYPCRNGKARSQGKSVQIVIFDIDGSRIAMDDFVGYLTLKPTIWYNTFSSTEKEERFRIVYVFDRPFPSEKYKDVYDWILKEEKLFSLVDDNDPHSRNPYQMAYGTDKDVYCSGRLIKLPDFVPLYFTPENTADEVEFSAECFNSDFENLNYSDFISKYSELYGEPLRTSVYTADPGDERIMVCAGPYYEIQLAWNSNGTPRKWMDGERRHSKLFVSGVKWRHIYGDRMDDDFMLYLITLEFYRHYDKKGFTKKDIKMLVHDIMAADIESVKPDGYDKWKVNTEYCKENDIPTKWLSDCIKREHSIETRKEKRDDKYNEWRLYYDEGVSIRKNLEILRVQGLKVPSLRTYAKFVNYMKDNKL